MLASVSLNRNGATIELLKDIQGTTNVKETLDNKPYIGVSKQIKPGLDGD